MTRHRRAELLVDAAAEVGEGPRWDARTGTLVWVDIHGKRVHRFDPSTGTDSHEAVDAQVGAAALRARGGYVLMLEGTVAAWTPGESPRTLLEVEAGQPGRRFNDAACDPAGRLLAGTMDTGEGGAGQGRLYSVEGGVARLMAEGIGLPNGVDWSPDGHRLYFTDSLTEAVGVFDYDPDTGAVGAQVGGVPVPGGLPDGHTVDADGNLWVALWSAGEVVRLTPEGRVLTRIAVPVPEVTSCAFGGHELATLYITTMRQPGADGREPPPHAGGLFAVDAVGAVGRPPHPFAG